jgi:hypothetical protein
MPAIQATTSRFFIASSWFEIQFLVHTIPLNVLLFVALFRIQAARPKKISGFAKPSNYAILPGD